MKTLAAFLVPILLGIACSTPARPASQDPLPQTPATKDDSGPPSCSDLPELACLSSPDCTLEKVEEATGGYLCRTASAPCETGFRQSTDRADACEARGGCTFVPGYCYCSPDVQCICGGGPPPTCKDGQGSDGGGAPKQ